MSCPCLLVHDQTKYSQFHRWEPTMWLSEDSTLNWWLIKKSYQLLWHVDSTHKIKTLTRDGTQDGHQPFQGLSPIIPWIIPTIPRMGTHHAKDDQIPLPGWSMVIQHLQNDNPPTLPMHVFELLSFLKIVQLVLIELQSVFSIYRLSVLMQNWAWVFLLFILSI